MRPSFAARAVRRAETRIAALADQLIDGFIDRGRIDVRADYTDALMSQVVGAELHCPTEDAPLLQRWARLFMLAVGRDLTDEQLDQMAEARLAFDDYFIKRFDEVRGAPTEDVLGSMVNEEVPGEEPLTIGELLMICELLLQGGRRPLETPLRTSSTI